MKINLTNLIRILFFILIFTLFLTNSFNCLDPDFGWHLKAGEEIYLTKHVPWKENYNYTLEGRTWVDHEWLLNLISYLVYTKIGYFALSVFFALIGLIIFILLNYCFLKKYIKDELHYFFVLAVETIALAGILPHSGVRMQELSIFMLLLELIIIDKFHATKNHKLLYFLPLLFFVWANLHGGFLIGLVVLWFYLSIIFFGPKIIKFFKISFFTFEDFIKKDLFYFFLSALASSLAVFITPYHYKYFSFMFAYANTFYLKNIMEWLPAYSAPIIYIQQIYFILFILLLIIFFLKKKNTKRPWGEKIELWHFFLSLLLFAAAFKSRRNFPLFFIASIPLITVAINKFNKNNLKRFYSLLSFKFINIYLAFVIVLSIALLLLSANFTNSPFVNQRFCRFYPCSALDKINTLPQNNLRIFNDYGSGGYLIWNWPDKKLFIDGRLPMLTVNNHSLLEEYYEFFDKEKIADKLNKYEINLILGKKFKEVKYNWFERIFLGFKNNKNQNNPLEEYLKNNENWKLIFADSSFFVYYKQK